MGPLEECIDSEESEADGYVCWTLCGDFTDSFGRWYEIEGPSLGLERSKVPSVEREQSKRLREENKGQSWADIESSRSESSDTTCPGVAAEVFCAPGADDEYPRVPWESGKGSTEPCAVGEILRDPWSEDKCL